jgi:hypothetical protein
VLQKTCLCQLPRKLYNNLNYSVLVFWIKCIKNLIFKVGEYHMLYIIWYFE